MYFIILFSFFFFAVRANVMFISWRIQMSELNWIEYPHAAAFIDSVNLIFVCFHFLKLAKQKLINGGTNVQGPNGSNDQLGWYETRIVISIEIRFILGFINNFE